MLSVHSYPQATNLTEMDSDSQRLYSRQETQSMEPDNFRLGRYPQAWPGISGHAGGAWAGSAPAPPLAQAQQQQQPQQQQQQPQPQQQPQQQQTQQQSQQQSQQLPQTQSALQAQKQQQQQQQHPQHQAQQGAHVMSPHYSVAQIQPQYSSVPAAYRSSFSEYADYDARFQFLKANSTGAPGQVPAGPVPAPPPAAQPYMWNIPPTYATPAWNQVPQTQPQAAQLQPQLQPQHQAQQQHHQQQQHPVPLNANPWNPGPAAQLHRSPSNPDVSSMVYVTDARQFPGSQGMVPYRHAQSAQFSTSLPPLQQAHSHLSYQPAGTQLSHLIHNRNGGDSDNIHKCHLCEKSFKRKSWLKRHLLSHSSVKPYNCPWCQSRHKRKDNLFQHMKLKHVHQVLQELVGMDDDGQRGSDERGAHAGANGDGDNNGGSGVGGNNALVDRDPAGTSIKSLIDQGTLNKEDVKTVLNAVIIRVNGEDR